MKTIKVTYTVDNENWSDEKFEDEPERVLYISIEDISEFIRGKLSKDEFLNEIYGVEIIR